MRSTQRTFSNRGLVFLKALNRCPQLSTSGAGNFRERRSVKALPWRRVWRFARSMPVLRTRPVRSSGLPKITAKDDTLVSRELDRLGNSLGDVTHLTNELKSHNVDFGSLTEKVEAGSPTQKLVLDLEAAVRQDVATDGQLGHIADPRSR